MFRINLDIERHATTLLDNGYGDLRAIAFLQYPIYCIHATILDSTPDELEKLDKAILDLVKENLIEPMSIATILGVSKSLIENRLKKMQNEGFIKHENPLSITNAGILFLSEGSEKRYIRRDLDIYLDGTTNKPLSKDLAWYYNSNFLSEDYYNIITKGNGDSYIERPFAPDLVHEPIVVDSIIEGIESLNENERAFCGIPLGLEKIESMSYTLLTLPLLISLADNEKPIKQITNAHNLSGDNNPILEIKKILEPAVQGILIQLRPNRNEGPIIHTNWFEVDNNDFGLGRIFHFPEEDFISLLESEYDLKYIEDKHIKCQKNELTVYITKTILNSAIDKKRIIRNIIRGRDYISRNPLQNGVWKLFISFKTKDELVKEMCEIYSTFTSFSYSPPLDLLLKMKEDIKGNFRRILVDLEMHQILEKIDMQTFMYDPEKK